MWRQPQTPSRAEVKERVGLYLYLPLRHHERLYRVNFFYFRSCSRCCRYCFCTRKASILQGINIVFHISGRVRTSCRLHGESRPWDNCPVSLKSYTGVPWLRPLVAGLSPRSPGFDSRPFYVGSLMDKVILWQKFHRVLQFPSVCTTTPVKHMPSFIYHLYCIILKFNSVVK